MFISQRPTVFSFVTTLGISRGELQLYLSAVTGICSSRFAPRCSGIMHFSVSAPKLIGKSRFGHVDRYDFTIKSRQIMHFTRFPSANKVRYPEDLLIGRIWRTVRFPRSNRSRLSRKKRKTNKKLTANFRHHEEWSCIEITRVNCTASAGSVLYTYPYIYIYVYTYIYMHFGVWILYREVGSMRKLGARHGESRARASGLPARER